MENNIIDMLLEIKSDTGEMKKCFLKSRKGSAGALISTSREVRQLKGQ